MDKSAIGSKIKQQKKVIDLLVVLFFFLSLFFLSEQKPNRDFVSLSASHWVRR